MKDSREMKMTMPESAPPTIDPNVTLKNMPENLTSVSTPMTSLAWPCVDSPQLPTVKQEIVIRMRDSREMKMTQPERAPPTIDSNVSLKNLPENLTPVSAPMTALAWPCVNSPLLPTGKPEIVNQMKDSREVRMTSPGNAPPTINLNVSMKYWEDRICHPLIYAGDFPQNVLKTNSHNPEAANIQHEADEIFTGRTATRTRGWLDVEDNSDTDSVAELEYKTWDDARELEFRNARGNTNVSLSQNSQMEMNREDVSDVDTDIDSDADYNARKHASRTWECQCAPVDVPPADFPPADVPPALVREPTSDRTRSNVDNDENTEKCEHEEWIDRIFRSPWMCDNHQHGWGNSDLQIYNSMDIADCLQPEDGNGASADFPPADVPLALVRKSRSDITRSNIENDENPGKGEHEEWINQKFNSPWICDNHQHGWRNSDLQIYDNMDIADCLQPEKGNCLSHAVCDDSVALMPLIQINRALFSDGGDTAGRSGHDSDDDGSPAGLLGYLPRCLYWPWSTRDDAMSGRDQVTIRK